MCIFISPIAIFLSHLIVHMDQASSKWLQYFSLFSSFPRLSPSSDFQTWITSISIFTLTSLNWTHITRHKRHTHRKTLHTNTHTHTSDLELLIFFDCGWAPSCYYYISSIIMYDESRIKFATCMYMHSLGGPYNVQPNHYALPNNCPNNAIPHTARYSLNRICGSQPPVISAHCNKLCGSEKNNNNKNQYRRQSVFLSSFIVHIAPNYRQLYCMNFYFHCFHICSSITSKWARARSRSCV